MSRVSRPSTAPAWLVVVGLIGLGVVELVRGSSHLLSEDSAAGAAGVSLDTASAPDVIYLFAVIGGTQALIGLLLLVAAFTPQLRLAVAGLEAARCALTIAVGYAKPSTASEVVGLVPDTLQLLASATVLAVLVASTRTDRRPRQQGVAAGRV